MEGKVADGLFVRVDKEDYDSLSKIRWRGRRNHTGKIYAIGAVEPSKTISMHNHLLGCVGVDHVDGDTLNNTRRNLRRANQSQNVANSRKRTGCSSQYKGVTAVREKWAAQITVRREYRFLGHFKTEEEAARAYDSAARTAFGEFARLNFG